MDILHLSDLHFGAPTPAVNWDSAADGLCELIRVHCQKPLVLALTGDLFWQGSDVRFDEARRFFGRLIHAGIPGGNILLCPGNHDLNTRRPSAPFEAFDRLSCSIRSDNLLVFSSATVKTIVVADGFFVLLNSAYHQDHTYGLINLDELRAALEAPLDLRRASWRIAMTHHHLIGQIRDDASTTRNAYPLLQILDHHTFRLILHGHQHAHQELPIGRAGMLLLGVGSAGYPTPRLANGFLHLRLGKQRAQVRRYVFSADATFPPGTGNSNILEVK